MYGRARLGHDIFLGEVVIPLREVEGIVDAASAPEVRRYILGRRNAKEKVNYDIHTSSLDPLIANRAYPSCHLLHKRVLSAFHSKDRCLWRLNWNGMQRGTVSHGKSVFCCRKTFSRVF